MINPEAMLPTVSASAAEDFLLKNGVVSKPVDVAQAFDASFLKAIPVADRLP